jgi:hypothetical protein
MRYERLPAKIPIIAPPIDNGIKISFPRERSIFNLSKNPPIYIVITFLEE